MKKKIIIIMLTFLAVVLLISGILLLLDQDSTSSSSDNMEDQDSVIVNDNGVYTTERLTNGHCIENGCISDFEITPREDGFFYDYKFIFTSQKTTTETISYKFSMLDEDNNAISVIYFNVDPIEKGTQKEITDFGYNSYQQIHDYQLEVTDNPW